jgi:hypothetical protein
MNPAFIGIEKFIKTPQILLSMAMNAISFSDLKLLSGQKSVIPHHFRNLIPE